MWIRWAMKEKEKRYKEISDIPFPLNYFYFVSSWKDKSYNGITDLLWNFAKIGWKGVFVSISWPFWAFPLTIVTIIFFFLALTSALSNFFFGILLGTRRYENYDDISDLDEYSLSEGEEEEEEEDTTKEPDSEDENPNDITISLHPCE